MGMWSVHFVPAWLIPHDVLCFRRLASVLVCTVGFSMLPDNYNTDQSKRTLGSGTWPAVSTLSFPMNVLKIPVKNGEIDIIEGVHDNEHNQVTWHTEPGMSLA